MKPILWTPKMLVCTLGGKGGMGLKKCTVCTHENVDIFGWPLSWHIFSYIPIHLNLLQKTTCHVRPLFHGNSTALTRQVILYCVILLFVSFIYTPVTLFVMCVRAYLKTNLYCWNSYTAKCATCVIHK